MARTYEMHVTEAWGYRSNVKLELPLYQVRISAGFPSPADDNIDRHLDLNEFLIAHPASTYFVRVEGDSMIEAGIQSGDILVVDWSLEPRSGDIVIAMINGEFLVKTFSCHPDGKKRFLLAGNPKYPHIELTDTMDVEIRGVVTSALHIFRKIK
ncbi:MAG TPA: translesion error-prone DNA polymerase V autoproteolytic subunit [Deltaproteobacteria bacterium]|jgi:DNA polymerase V|nr:translesion error-prone DNA polymerase V autoproteolytic subunit [Deltaproteobacteria bacterium]HOI07850.1 translesion error-prone DNA polymerase V autoproteolytic subunit [Deltaproteobacteria bacterium]